MPFKIKETSNINATGSGYSNQHMEITDAVEAAVNHLGSQSVGTKVTIIHTINIERLE
jgi:hypothetical protein